MPAYWISGRDTTVRTLVAAAAILASVSAVQAKECRPLDKGYEVLAGVRTWANDTGATIKSTKTGFLINGKTFNADVNTHSDYFDFVDGDVESFTTPHYEVLIERHTDNLVSPELAKWTGGSATFVRKCK